MEHPEEHRSPTQAPVSPTQWIDGYQMPQYHSQPRYPQNVATAPQAQYPQNAVTAPQAQYPQNGPAVPQAQYPQNGQVVQPPYPQNGPTASQPPVYYIPVTVQPPKVPSPGTPPCVPPHTEPQAAPPYPPYGMQPGYGGWQPYGMAPSQRDGQGFGIASLVLGICGAGMMWVPILSLICSILGLVFGLVSLHRKRTGLGVAGVILSCLAPLLFFVAIGFVFLAFSAAGRW